jgi:hypothetical protein
MSQCKLFLSCMGVAQTHTFCCAESHLRRVARILLASFSGVVLTLCFIYAC